MGISHRDGIESSAAVFHHPLHPLAVALPIGSLAFALGSDIAFLCTSDIFWTHASFWLLVAGVATGFLAAGLGMIDYFAIAEVRDLGVARLHGMGNLAVIALAVANLLVHWFVANPPLGWLAVALSAVIVGLLGVTGHLGGALAYRYRIGQIAPQNGGRTPDPIDTASLMHRSRS